MVNPKSGIRGAKYINANGEERYQSNGRSVAKGAARWATPAYKERKAAGVLSVKLEVMAHYCPDGEIACACCGETWPVFLAIDHMEGCGGEKRKVQGKGTAFWRWLKRNNYPPGYQVLCHNCNHAKHWKKICPHKSTNVRKA